MAIKHASSGGVIDLRPLGASLDDAQSTTLVRDEERMMRVHYFQHVAFEGLGSVATWLTARGIEIKGTHLDEAADLPDLADVDWLIVLGGPMSVNDERRHAWLAAERAFIRAAVEQGKRVLGICLGAQLIASALGARRTG